MKLTDEALTKMVLDELNRLDEKTINVRVSDINDIASKLGKNSSDFKAAAKKEFGDNNQYRKTKSAIDSFSDLGGDENVIDDFDVWIANNKIKTSKPDSDVKAGKKVSDFLKTSDSVSPDVKNWVDQTIKAKPPEEPSQEQFAELVKLGLSFANAYDSERRKGGQDLQTDEITKNYLIPLTNYFDNFIKLNTTSDRNRELISRVKSRVREYLSLPFNNPEAKASSAVLGKIADVWDIKDYDVSFSRPDIIQTQAALKNTGEDAELGGTKLTAGAMSSGTAAVFQGFFDYAKETTGTDTIESRTSQLIAFSNEMKGVAELGKEIDDESIKSFPLISGMLKNNRPDVIAVSSQVLLAMEEFSKEIEKLESGKAAEAFLAALYSGGVSGGLNGAADMIAGSTDKKVLLSAKIYSQLGGAAGIKQKEGKRSADGKGVYAATQKGILYYVIGLREYYDPKFRTRRDKSQMKIGGDISGGDKKTPEKTAGIRFIIVGIGKKKGNRYPIHDVTGTVISHARVDGDSQVLIGDALKGVSMSSISMGTVPLFSGDVTNIGINSLDTMLNKAVKNLKDETLTAIQGIYQKLNAMDNSTKVYTGDKDRPSDAAKSIRTNYSGIKSDFNAVLKKFGGPKEELISENNKKLTEELLDKLIKAVIL